MNPRIDLVFSWIIRRFDANGNQVGPDRSYSATISIPGGFDEAEVRVAVMDSTVQQALQSFMAAFNAALIADGV